MNVNDLTFGIEIETNAPYENHFYDSAETNDPETTRWGVYISDFYSDFGEWMASDDCSIRVDSDEYEGVEFKSPILKGKSGLKEVKNFTKYLKSKGVKTHPSCGIHIHVGIDKTKYKVKHLKRLAHLVNYFDVGLFASTGSTNRYCGGASRWCKTYSRQTYYDNQRDNPQTVEKNNKIELINDTYAYRRSGEKGSMINFSGLVGEFRDTIEFRFLPSSTNPIRICGWIQLCLGLVVRAYKARVRTKKNIKINPEKNLIDLLKYLKWDNEETYGYLGVYKKERFIEEFVKLAKTFTEKYSKNSYWTKDENAVTISIEDRDYYEQWKLVKIESRRAR